LPRLAADLKAALAQIGIDAKLRLPHLKSGTRPPGRDYRNHYDSETRTIVGALYGREIKTFGFEF
jgi:hypothetical protein